MNLEERQKYILEKVNSSGKVITSKLSKDLQTSRETIRKDLYTLDQQQKLIAVRGGAVSISNNIITETIYNKRISQNIIQKDEIANKALSLIKNNQIVYLDNGSSIVELAKKIRTSNLKNLTIITSSLNVINIFHGSNNTKIICLGGGLRPEEGSFSGPLTLQNINSLYCDIGFFGCGGISLTAGITNHYFSEVEASKKMLTHSKINLFLATYDKFNTQALYHVVNLSDIDHIISDSSLSESIKNKFILAGYAKLII